MKTVVKTDQEVVEPLVIDVSLLSDAVIDRLTPALAEAVRSARESAVARVGGDNGDDDDVNYPVIAEFSNFV